MPTTSNTSTTLSLVERTSLPKIIVKARGGATQMEAYVNAYIVGEQNNLMNGNWARPLYYLSLVGMRGQGTTLQGIFARLVSIHSKDVSIEGIGDVALAHHRPALTDCGYSLHWNFEQAEVAPHHDLHAVIESHMLTICDPVRSMAVRQRTHHTAKNPSGKAGKRQKEQISLSTAKQSKAQNSLDEIRNREKKPMFLLMVPSWHQGDTHFLQQLHLSFLDPRIPWPLDPSWASFLWERGVKHNEIERLETWGYTPSASATTADEEDEGETGDERSVPFIAEAYFCRPKPALIQKDLQEALVTGRISSHLPSHIVALPPIECQPDEEPYVAVAGM